MVHCSWQQTIENAYGQIDESYRLYLETDREYFPKQDRYFSAFGELPREKVRYILFGQDPYPREESATGYAFIDGRVSGIFGDRGLSKEVNRATSLRNFIKMALLARGDLTSKDTSQEAIARLDKSSMIESIGELRVNFEKNGVLLLNTALVFSSKAESRAHIKAWQPFVEKLLAEMRDVDPTLILFGAHAKALKKLKGIKEFRTIELEHPYNHTFISNPEALKLFGPMELLAK
jgi:uracil-DNA glycosylase